MTTPNRIVMCVVTATLLVSCGKSTTSGTNNTNGSNNATNNGSNNANNTSNAPNNTNNTINSSNSTNNTTGANNSNNSTRGNNSNNTNNMTNMYTAHDFTCPDAVTPAGTVADLIGTYNIGGGCVGENNFEILEMLCPTGVLTNVQFTDWTGRLVVNDANQFVVALSNSFSAEIFAPEACTTQLGGGTCDGLADFIDATAQITTTTCVDEPAAGDCYCTITGPGGLRRIGHIEDGANPGEVVLSFLVRQDDDSYVSETETWEFETDGMTAAVQNTNVDNNTSYTAAVDPNGSSECERYCLGFMALCNDDPNIGTPYLDTLDCVGQCMGFAPGLAGDMAGDTRACRIYHLGAAADPGDVANPDTHCPHAQATATPPCAD